MLLPLLLVYPVIPSLTNMAVAFAKGCSRTGAISGGFEKLERTRWFRLDMAFHLWFLLFALSFCIVALPLHEVLRRRAPVMLERPRAWLDSAVGSPLAPLLLSLVLAPFFIAPELLGTSGARYGIAYLGCYAIFSLGWGLHSLPGSLDRLGRWGVSWLVLSLAVTALSMPATLRVVTDPEAGTRLGLIAAAGRVLSASFATLGMLGLFQRCLNRPCRAGASGSNRPSGSI